jgi:uracil-DNA glycosylase family 4
MRSEEIARMDWAELRASMAACRACSLCQNRQQVVPGDGDENADWLFVGEAPGAEEDASGHPFVGPAGRLFDAMLAAIGLGRDKQVYIVNAVKCRPDDGPPTEVQMAACRPYLERQIELLQPRLIVALGRPAAQTLLHEPIKISSVRGVLHRFGEIPLIVTYHPAYLLRSPGEKAKVWEDLCQARRTMKNLE